MADPKAALAALNKKYNLDDDKQENRRQSTTQRNASKKETTQQTSRSAAGSDPKKALSALNKKYGLPNDEGSISRSYTSGLQSWQDETNRFVQQVSDDYRKRDGVWQDSYTMGNYRATTTAKARELQNRANAFSEYLTNNRDQYDAETVDAILSSLNEQSSWLGELGTSLDSEYDYWSQWENAQEYDDYQRGMSIDIAETELKLEGLKMEQEYLPFKYGESPEYLVISEQVEEQIAALEKDLELANKVQNPEAAPLDNGAPWYEKLWASAKRGYLGSKLGTEGWKEMSGQANNAEMYSDILAGEEYQFEPNKWWEKAVYGAAELGGQLVEQQLDPTTWAMALGAAGAAGIAGQVGPQVLVPEEIISVPGAFAAGYGTGSALHAAKVEGGHAYYEMLEMGITPETAAKYAAVVGGVNGAIEALQVDELFDMFKVAQKTNVDESVLKQIIRELYERGVLGTTKETAQEVAQEVVTMGGVTAAHKADKGEWAYSFEEAASRAGDVALSSALMFGLTGVAGTGVNVAGNAAMNKAQTDAGNTAAGNNIVEMGDDSVRAVIEEGLAAAPGSDRHALAKELQAQLDSGKKVNTRKLGMLYGENVKVYDEDNVKEVLTRTAREAVGAEESDVFAEDDTTDTRAENDSPYNVMSVNPAARANRFALDTTGYGKHGDKTFRELVDSDTTGRDVRQMREAFDPFYQAGMAGVEIAQFGNAEQRIAYNAGKQDAIAAQGNANRIAAAQKGHKTVGIQDSEAAKKIAPADAKVINTFAQALNMPVFAQETVAALGDEAGAEGETTPTGEVILAMDSYAPGDLTTFFHEGALHRMRQLAPTETDAVINAIVSASLKNTAYSGKANVNAVAAIRKRYTDQGGFIPVDIAMEEVAAETIGGMFGKNPERATAILNDVMGELEAEAKRNGKTDAEAKAEAKSTWERFVQWLHETIAKLKAYFNKNKGTMDAETKAGFQAAINDLTETEQLWKDALKASVQKAQELSGNVEKTQGAQAQKEGSRLPIEDSDYSETADGIRFAAKMSFAEQVDAALSYDLPKNADVLVCYTPEMLQAIGLQEYPVLMTQKHIRDAVKPKSKSNKKQHGLPVDTVKSLPEILENPVMILRSLTDQESIVVVSSLLDGDGLPVIVSIKPNGDGRYNRADVVTNFATSMYGRTGFSSFIARTIAIDGVLYNNKKRTRSLFARSGHQMPQALNRNGFFEENIAQYSSVVNPNPDLAADDSPSLKRPAKDDGRRLALKGEKAVLSEEDKANLQAAKQMKENGKSDEEIYKATGWYTQSDGKWRSEIPDEIMVRENFLRTGLQSVKDAEADKYLAKAENLLKTGAIDEETYDELVEFAESIRTKDLTSGPLSSFLNAPKLYEAYPQLKNVKLFFQKLHGMEGYTDAGKNQIVLDPDGLRDAGQTVREGLAHEIQHIIQNIEGFTRGSSPAQAGGYEAYRRTGGEIEARDVEDRLRMTPEERRAYMPVRFSLKDSTGKTLSKAQQEYFKDSKVRDEDGNLLVMYHGSHDAGFHVFDPNFSDDSTSLFFVDSNDVARSYSGTSEIYAARTFRTAEDVNSFIAEIGYADEYEVNERDGKFILLTDGDEVETSDTAAGIYEEFCIWSGVGRGAANYQVYLNITDPLIVDASGADWDQLPGLDGAEYSNTRDYARYAKAQGHNGVVIKNLYDVGAFGNNGAAEATVAVAFSGEQVKSTENRTPTDNHDIRFSLKKPVEETKNLIALHNLNAGKLNKVLDLGGFPMPSIAVTRTDIPHTNFGDITLVMNKNAIDPQANRKNTVYSADAWTPTVPPTAYKPSESRLREIKKTVDDLAGGREVRDVLDHIAFDEDNVKNVLSRYDGDLVNAHRDNNTLKYAFLKSIGAKIDLPMKEKDLFRYGEVSNAGVRYFAGKLANGKQTVNHYLDMSIRDAAEDPALRKAVVDTLNFDITREMTEEQRKHFEAKPVHNDDNLRLSDIDGMLYAALEYFESGIKRTVDRFKARTAVQEYVEKHGLQEQYEAWLTELFEGVVEKTGIYNNKDYFTPSGNRRSFEQLHVPVTLENIVKVMASQNGGNTKNVAGFNGVKTLRAGMAKRFKNIADMHKMKDRLQNLTEEEFKAIHDQLSSRMFDIIERIIKTGPASSMNGYMRMDSVGEMMMEIAESGKYTIDSIVKKYAEYQYNIGNALANDIKELLFDVSQMPTNMFEAKPERAVGFDEVLAAVVPDDTDQKLIDRLKAAGVGNVMTYAKGDDAARLELVNSVEAARFSLKRNKTVEQENAELRETIAALKEQFTITKFAKPDKKAIEQLAKTLVKRNIGKGETDVDAIAASLTEIFDMANNQVEQLYNTYGDAWFSVLTNKAEDVAREIMESAVEVDDSMLNEMRTVRKYLRTVRLTLPHNLYSDLVGYENIAEFKRAYKGRIRLVDKGGLPVDSAYMELSGMFPYLFPEDIVNPADQLTQIAEVLDSLHPVERNPYERDMDEAVAWLTTEVLNQVSGVAKAKPTFADKAAAAKDKAVLGEKMAAGREMAASNRKHQEQLAAVREQKNARIQELIEKHREQTRAAVLTEREKQKQKIDKLKESVSELEAIVRAYKKADRNAAVEIDSEILKVYQSDPTVFRAAMLQIEPKDRAVVREAYDKLLEEHGAIKPGENPVREVQVPKKTADGKKVSQTVRTVMEAAATPEDALPTIEQMVADGLFSYDVYTDEDALADAKLQIDRKTLPIAFADWVKDVESGIVSKQHTVLGWALYNYAVNAGETATAMKVLSLMVGHQRNAAQALQATRVLKQLSPEAQMYEAQLTVERINEDLARREKARIFKAPGKKKIPASANLPVEEWMEKTGELLTKKLVSRTKTPTAKAKTTAQIILDDLWKVASKKVKAAKRVDARRSNMDVIEDLFNNQEEFQRAWDAAKAHLEEQYGDNPAVMEALDEWKNSALDYRAAFSSEVAGKYNVQIDPKLIDKFFEQKDQAGRDEVMKDIYRNIGSQLPSTFVDKWNAWRYMAMLGNVRTHVRNVLGNAGFAPVVLAKDTLAAGIESVVSRVTHGKLNRTKAGIVLSKSDRALLKAAWADFKNIRDLLDGGRTKDNANPNKYIEEGRRIFKFKPLEKARRFSGDSLETEDMWFSQPHYAYAMLQYCKAHNITAEQIARGKAIDPARAYAMKEAQKATYRDANAFSNFVSRIGRTSDAKNPAGKVMRGLIEGILPFRRTPANILVRGLEYSPLGLLKSLSYDLVQVKKYANTNGEQGISGAQMIDNLSAGLTGTGLLALGAWLAAQGLLRGHGDDDEKEKEFEELMGHQAYSLELPDGTSITLDWLAPEALPFFVGVNLYEATRGSDKEITLEALLSSLTMVTEPMLEMSMLQGLNDMIESVGYNKSNGIVAMASSALTSYLTQGLPTLAGQIERTTESYRMSTYPDKNNKWLTPDMQRTLGKISQKLPVDFFQIPYVDAWGRKESSGKLGARAANNMLNPAYTSKVTESAMEKELLRLYDATGEDVFPALASKSITVDKERKDLTGEEYVKYATAKGQNAYKLVTDLTQSREYKALDDAEKVDAVQAAYDMTNQLAKADISDFKPDKWVTEAQNSRKLGMTTSEFIVAKVKYGTENLTTEKAHEVVDAGVDIDEYLDFKMELSAADKANGDEGVKQAEFVDILLERNLSDDDNWALYFSKYDSKSARAAEKHGISAELFMTAKLDLENIKPDYRRDGTPIPDSRKPKVERYLASVCSDAKEYLFFLGMEFESVKDDRDYIAYFGREDD